jgi:hypothetical protein
MLALTEFAIDLARGIELADSRGPVAINARTKIAFRAGIGPHSENETIRLVLNELSAVKSETYGEYQLGVPYPKSPGRRCDLCLGTPSAWLWAIEAKMLRLYGDNGKLNDNMLMHILSPYPEHRSALTDCQKLIESGLKGRKAIVVYGYESAQFPTAPAIRAFELLARDLVRLSERATACFRGLMHPVHQSGVVVAWEIAEKEARLMAEM